MNGPVARCKICGQLMTPDSSCWPIVIDEQGNEYERIRYGGKGDHPERWAEGPCGDCNVLPGKVHHWSCDQEVCPKCGFQMISCAHIWDMLAEEGACDLLGDREDKP